MNHPRLFLSATLALISISIFGQTDFRPGYYISNDMDTVFGQIDNRGDMRNSIVCTFRADEGAESVEFRPGEISEYRFEEGKYYISREVPVNSGLKQVFTEYLVNGIADLYYYRDGESNHYLIEKENGRMLELTNKKEEIYIEGVRYQRETNKHIGLLKSTFSDCPEMQQEIEKASLTHKSLINITNNYHEYVCDGEQCIIYEKVIPAIHIEVAPLVGMGVSSISFLYHPVLAGLDFENSLAPFLGLQLNTSAPRLNDRISLQLASTLAKNYFYSFHQEQSISSVTNLDAHLNTLFLKSVFAVKYTFPRGKVRPTLTAGGLINLLLYSSTWYITEQVNDQVVITNEYPGLPINNLLWGGFVHLGLDYHLLKNRVFFSNLGFDIGSGVSNEVYTKLWTVSLSVGTYF